MMDSELFGQSALAETFEWMQSSVLDNNGSDRKEIDVEMTLLKNLMEAQSHAIGSPLMSGPLHGMMSQLGINMPIPPPMKQKP